MAKNKLASKLTSINATVPYKPSPAEAAREKRYQAEDALRTLTRAGEIQRDKGLMREVKKVATEQLQTLRSVVKKR
jgi:hypothetical protein